MLKDLIKIESKGFLVGSVVEQSTLDVRIVNSSPTLVQRLFTNKIFQKKKKVSIMALPRRMIERLSVQVCASMGRSKG